MYIELNNRWIEIYGFNPVTLNLKFILKDYKDITGLIKNY